jgi:hypothetical protein
MALISAKGGTKNLSLLVRQSLEARLDQLDRQDKAAKRKTAEGGESLDGSRLSIP